ncbi:DUF4235 domain-containing protein [Bifidobacterium tibiigranuli]|jgi:hypothetical protein|uniref:DUF4235 domain-containing protein n=1 Tax=Bifidobacterium tibiigranuli TaxID=2172043 RepID=UPI0026F28CBE|nr:DUF4235 domain-containing protein [Bifidobacterium tibiigranuli]MCI1649060.1 DUF4235 domain-containing protein [Bifidobacterium tibiigranuli]MCI2186295.1 DUF4235 domain-containing protein [Bifidobacterium tibiigranuli]MCI2203879.1 DUF4235 domain-containing protein [Bifidobacterium tibiigranuli]
MSDTSKDSEVRLGKSANSIVDGLGAVDSKVDAMTHALKNDPDTLGDKIFKAAVPALTGLVAGKIFQTLWNKGAARRHSGSSEDDAQQGLLMTLLFAGLSAAFGAILSQLSVTGSRAFVSHRQVKRQNK